MRPASALANPRPSSAMDGKGARTSTSLSWADTPVHADANSEEIPSIPAARSARDRPASATGGFVGRPSSAQSSVLSGTAQRNRPSTAMGKIGGSALLQPLHPMEKLGRGLGSNIAIDEGSAEVLNDRGLARRAETLSRTMAEKAAAHTTTKV